MQLPHNNLDIVDVDRESMVREIIPIAQRLPPCRPPLDSTSNKESEPVCSGSSKSVRISLREEVSPGGTRQGRLAGELPERGEPVRNNPITLQGNSVGLHPVCVVDVVSLGETQQGSLESGLPTGTAEHNSKG